MYRGVLDGPSRYHLLPGQHRVEATQGAVFAHLTKVCAADICTSIDKSAATSSHHLTLLGTAGPVASQKRAHDLRKRIVNRGSATPLCADPRSAHR